MLGLLANAKRTSSPAKPRLAHPRLEALEDRSLPSTVSLAVTYGTGKNVTLSGTLGDTQTPANQTITIGGQAVGSATTNAQGQFSITLEASALGFVTARAADGSSNTAYTMLTDQPPTLTAFDAVEGTADIWTFSGTVTYFRYFDTLTINLGGMPVTFQTVRTTTADNTGHFSFSIMLNGLSTDNGSVWAQAVSPWGTLSNQLTDYVHQTGT